MPWGMDNLCNVLTRGVFFLLRTIYPCLQFLSVQNVALAAVWKLYHNLLTERNLTGKYKTSQNIKENGASPAQVSSQNYLRKRSPNSKLNNASRVNATCCFFSYLFLCSTLICNQLVKYSAIIFIYLLHLIYVTCYFFHCLQCFCKV